MFANVSTGADTKANTTHRDVSAPQVSDLSLVEDGSERGGGLVSKGVA